MNTYAHLRRFAGGAVRGEPVNRARKSGPGNMRSYLIRR
jgi:hypothetical protein